MSIQSLGIPNKNWDLSLQSNMLVWIVEERSY